MSRHRHEIDNARAHIMSLWAIIMLLSVFMAWAFIGWSKAPEDLTLHIPPDLSNGATLKVGESPKPNLYTFSFHIWQQVNRWAKNGQDDFPRNIYTFAAYMTPRFRASLERDMKKRGKRGELAGRVRALHQDTDAPYEDRRVDVIGPGSWVVWIDAVIEETVAGLGVKTKRIRYPMRVVRYDVDREKNPWGWALDGFANPGPSELSDTEPDPEKTKEKSQ